MSIRKREDSATWLEYRAKCDACGIWQGDQWWSTERSAYYMAWHGGWSFAGGAWCQECKFERAAA